MAEDREVHPLEAASRWVEINHHSNSSLNNLAAPPLDKVAEVVRVALLSEVASKWVEVLQQAHHQCSSKIRHKPCQQAASEVASRWVEINQHHPKTKEEAALAILTWEVTNLEQSKQDHLHQEALLRRCQVVNTLTENVPLCSRK